MKDKKKKYNKKHYTDGRVDMSKGGRVSYQRGEKVEIDPRTGKALPRTSIERPVAVGEPVRSTVQPKTIPQEDTTNYYRKAMENNPLGKVTGVPNVVGTGRTGFERTQTNIPPKKDPDEITSIERIPTEEELERQRLEEERRAAEEAARKAAEEAARKAAEEEAARKPLTPREMAQQSAEGTLPIDARIPDAIKIPEGREQQIQTLEGITPVDVETVQPTTAEQVTQAGVTTDDVIALAVALG